MAEAATLQRPGAALHVVAAGAGRPVVFQHGLGGDAAQVAAFFPDGAGCSPDGAACFPEGAAWRRLTLECRGHGGSEAGPATMFSIAAFADDVIALADAQGLDRFVLGGTSMGAAIATRIAALHPDRVQALVLVRPAWLFAPAPENMRGFALVAECLRAGPPDVARSQFLAHGLAARLAEEAPDNLASMLGFFDRPNPGVVAELLARIAVDGPGVAPARLTMKALVIGNEVDHVHPLATARALAAALPDAALVCVTSKAREPASHAAETRTAIAAFLAALPTA